MDVSVVLPVLNERENLRALLPRLSALFEHLHLRYELITVDGGSRDGTREIARELGARVVDERRRGYAGALATGFAEANGDYILTLDADMSHEPAFVAKMWRARHQADIVIASRYVRGGAAYTAWGRRALSRLLNLVLRRVLSMPVRDLSSGFRLYRRQAVQGLELEGRNFEVLEEILVKAFARGFSVVEVPFTYFPREEGSSHARLIRFGLDLARSAMKLWWLRNSLDSADYDERAFYSVIPPQRYWQRRRHHIVGSWARAVGLILDIGSGSSLIIQSLNDAVALEYNSRQGALHSPSRNSRAARLGVRAALQGSGLRLRDLIGGDRTHSFRRSPFQRDAAGAAPGGMLIIGTPDYDTVGWRTIEPIYGFLMPGGYHDEHITHYTRAGLLEILARHGFVHEETAYVLRSELIMRCRKSELPGETAIRVLAPPETAQTQQPAEPLETVRDAAVRR